MLGRVTSVSLPDKGWFGRLSENLVWYIEVIIDWIFSFECRDRNLDQPIYLKWWDWLIQLQLVWPPPKQPDRDSTVSVISTTSTKLILYIHRVVDIRNNVCKPHRIVWEHYRDISGWKSRMIKPTLLGDVANCRVTFTYDEANWVWMKPTSHLRRVSKHSDWLLIGIQQLVIHQYWYCWTKNSIYTVLKISRTCILPPNWTCQSDSQ